MSRTGRPRKPADAKQGHYQPRALEVVEATPLPERFVVPLPPRTAAGEPLLDSTLLVWDAYWLSPVVAGLDAVGGIDRYGVEDWIRLVNELTVVQVAIEETGRVVEGSMGQPAPNPLLAYADRLRERILQREERLGLNPRDRARLGIAVGESKLTALRLNEELDRAARGGRLAEDADYDAVPSRDQLRDEARRLGIRGYSRMTKDDLAAAVAAAEEAS